MRDPLQINASTSVAQLYAVQLRSQLYRKSTSADGITEFIRASTDGRAYTTGMNDFDISAGQSMLSQVVLDYDRLVT